MSEKRSSINNRWVVTARLTCAMTVIFKPFRDNCLRKPCVSCQARDIFRIFFCSVLCKYIDLNRINADAITICCRYQKETRRSHFSARADKQLQDKRLGINGKFDKNFPKSLSYSYFLISKYRWLKTSKTSIFLLKDKNSA